MKKIILATLYLSLTYCVIAEKMPSIQLDSGNWQLDKNMTLENGVLTITGEPNKYKKATIKVPLKNLPLKKIFIHSKVKSQKIKQGDFHYKLPKLKVYLDGKPDTRAAALIPEGTLNDWTEHSLAYTLPLAKNNEKLVVELSMEHCKGIVSFKDLNFSTKPPANVQQFPFAIPDKPVCKLNIDTSKTKKFNNNLLGLNSHFMGYNKTLTYKDRRIQNTIKKIKVPLMRFPGGTVANWYNYETDMWEVLPETKTSEKLMKRMNEALTEKRKFGFDEYLKLSKENGFDSTVVLNVLHDSPERCAARVLDRKKKGLKFSWIELGNENYAKAQQSSKIKNVKQYIEKCKAVAKELKKASPETIVALNIHAPKDHWSKPISKENFYDAIVMHPYSHAGMRSAVLTPVVMLEGLCAYAQLNKKLKAYREQFGDKPLLLTEWGVMGSHKTIRNHLATLGTADMFFRIIEESENGPVKNACLHVFSDGYMGLYDADPKTNQYYKRGYGVMYDLLTDAFLDNEVFEGKSSSPMLTSNQHATMARATKTKDGKIKIYAVNLLPVKSKLELSLDGEKYTGSYSLESFYEKNLYQQKKYKEDENPCKKTKGAGTIALPPYSISIATLSQ